MRNRPITSKQDILDVLRRCQWCHVAMVDAENKPYVIPMNFGFIDDTIYIHGAAEGKKIGILRNNPAVCINFSIDQELRYQSEQVACSWSMKYRSVLCYGTVEFVEDPVEKMKGMNVVMAQYTNREFTYNHPSIREVSVLRIKVARFEGRAYGY